MKTIFTFVIFWLFSTAAFFALKSSSKTALKHLTKSLLFGLATATIASVVLTLIVYVF